MEMQQRGGKYLPMIIPTFSKHKVADESGDYTPEASLYQDILNQQMQICLSDDGWQVPALDTDTINQFADPANANARLPGCIWYDQTTNELKVLIAAGIIKIVQFV
jgi:hypothetical protein